MAKLPEETTAKLATLKQQSLGVFDQATAAEFTLFELFGETDATLSYLDELKNVAEEATSCFSQLSNLQLNIAQAQPTASSDMLELVAQAIERIQARIPALERIVSKKLRQNGTCHESPIAYPRSRNI